MPKATNAPPPWKRPKYTPKSDSSDQVPQFQRVSHKDQRKVTTGRQRVFIEMARGIYKTHALRAASPLASTVTQRGVVYRRRDLTTRTHRFLQHNGIAFSTDWLAADSQESRNAELDRGYTGTGTKAPERVWSRGGGGNDLRNPISLSKRIDRESIQRKHTVSPIITLP